MSIWTCECGHAEKLHDAEGCQGYHWLRFTTPERQGEGRWCVCVRYQPNPDLERAAYAEAMKARER
jgi:hypothetical protein